jgi:hypothetical protein
MKKAQRIDYIGSILFVSSITLCLVPMTLGGGTWDHSNDEFMRYLVLVFMMHKEEGGGSPQIKVDIQRRLIAT